MTRPNRLGAWAGVTTIVATLGLLHTVSATAEEEMIEEVVVTGSYLKRSAEDSPSPLSVVSKADLDEIGAVDMSDIVRSMTFSSGSIGGAANGFSGDNGSTGNANINLRNLGSGSTLVLLNGKRTVATAFDNVGSGYVDLSSLVPTIALQRVEVLKDGSSALYGSDAVAGVVNFITRKDFEGVELSYSYGVDDESGEQKDNLVELIMGVYGDMGSITVSGSYLDRSGLQIGDRYEDYGRSGLSSFGQPGRYIPLAGTTNTPSFFSPGSDSYGVGADPDCDLAAANDGPMGVMGVVNGQCIYDFSSLFNLVMETTQYKFHMDGVVNVTDDVEVYSTVSFSDSSFTRGNSLYPDVNFATIGPDHYGNQLDAQRRGIAPVTVLALQRMMGGQYESSDADRPINTDSTYDQTNFRLVTGATWDFEMGDRNWTMDTSIAFSQQNSDYVNPADSLTANTNAAYVGLGGVNCDAINGTPGSGNDGTGNCFYYNSFQTSVYDPVTGQKWNPDDTSAWAADPSMTVGEAARRYRNPAELLQWMQGEITSDTKSEQVVFDIVFAGDIMDTRSGTVGLAVGGQYRRDSIGVDWDTNSNNNNFKFIYGREDWSNKLSAYSLFAEVNIPLGENAEVTLAGRYENFDQIDTDTFDPKATVLWRPTYTVSLRASVGTSFRVASLLQDGGSATTLLNSSDPFSGTGGLAFRPTIATGNPSLKPEQATAWNIGVSWIPDGALEGLHIDADYYNYQYDDLISREGHQDLVNEDNLSRCPNGNNSDPAAGPLCGTSDQNGDGLDEVYSIGPGIPDKVLRSEDANLLRTSASYFNAPSLDTSGIDLTIGYDFSVGELGDFRTNLGISYTLEYDIVTDKGAKIDGVGSRNAGNSIGFPLPEYKANLLLGWAKNRHSATAIVYYIEGFKDDVPQSALRGSFIGFAPTIDSFTTVDLQYNFELPEFGFQSEGSMITLGIKNAANEVAPRENTDGGFDPFTHDPRGRIYYAKYLMSI